MQPLSPGSFCSGELLPDEISAPLGKATRRAHSRFQRQQGGHERPQCQSATRPGRGPGEDELRQKSVEGSVIFSELLKSAMGHTTTLEDLRRTSASSSYTSLDVRQGPIADIVAVTYRLFDHIIGVDEQ